MSTAETTGSKKQRCQDMHHSEYMIRDSMANFVDFQIIGTDPDVVGGVVSGAAMTEDYAPLVENRNPDGTFLICIETSGGIYHVRLPDGNEFVITAVQSAAYAGQWYPAKIIEVLVGTTGDFSVGY
jgi:hypothetical protein